MGVVEGRVLFQSMPLPGGTIHFFQGQEKVGSFMIRGDGTYAAEVPLGPVTVAVENVSVKYQDRDAILKVMKESGFDVDPKQRRPESPANIAAKMSYVEIPERFRHHEKSGLEHVVMRGRQVRDFDLK